jgi:hypothetical protein
MQKAVAVGCTINFAGIKWRVLAIVNNKALLISKRVLEKGPYNTELIDVTWEDCTLRKYLNGEFLDRFSEKEKEAVAETVNINADNPWYGTSGGNTTTDKVFLLSFDDIAMYLGDSGALAQRKSASIKYFSIQGKNKTWHKIDKPDTSKWCIFSDQYNAARAACNNAGAARRWLLRSSGDHTNHNAYVINDGSVDVGGAGVDVECGIRPALWLNL